MPVVFFVLLLFVFNVMVEVHAGYPRVLFEREPNDTLDQAASVRGEARLAGEVSGDDVDLFWWVLDDGETDRLWHLELQGAGDVSAELLWPAEEHEEPDTGAGFGTFGAAPAFGSEPAPGAETRVAEETSLETSLITLSVSPRTSRDSRGRLIVPPGEHLVRFLPGAVGSEYQLLATPGDRIRIRGQVGPAGSDDIAVEPGRQWFYQLDVPEMVIPLTAVEEARQLWRVSLLGELGAPLEAWIEDADGEGIARKVSGSPMQEEWGRLALEAGSRLHVRHAGDGVIGRVGVRMSEDGLKPPAREVAATVVTAGDPGSGADKKDEQEERIIAGRADDRVWLDVGDSFSATLERRDPRFLAFQVEETIGALAIGIAADDPEAVSEICLNRLGGDRTDVCRRSSGNDTPFSRMSLPPGGYTLQLSRPVRTPGSESMNYTLSLAEDEPADAGHVHRPNDSADWVLPLRPDTPIRGHFHGDGEAWFELVVSGQTQQWDFSTEAEASLDGLSLYRRGDRQPLLSIVSRRSQRDQQDFWLDNVRLLPGRYHVRLEGKDIDYSLLATPLGKPAPGMEQEPNDDETSSNPIWLGEPVQGTFHSTADEDHFHFNLPGRNRLVVSLEPPADGEIEATLLWHGQTVLSGDPLSEPGVLSEVLPPGDYTLMVEGSRASRERYRLQLDLVSPWAPELAPSLAMDRQYAPLLPADGVVATGMGASGSTSGFMRLPITEQARELHFTLNGRTQLRRLELSFENAAGEQLAYSETEDDTGFSLKIPGGEQWYVRMRGRRAGNGITISDPALTLPPLPSVALELEGETAAVPPFFRHGQRLTTRLTLENTGDQPRLLLLHGHASHAGAAVEGLPEQIELAPGQHATLPLTWSLPPEMLEDTPLSLFVRAGEDVVRHDVALALDAAPADPFALPDVPVALQGLADLAWNALGATFVDAQTGEPVDGLPQRQRDNVQFLIDGMASAGRSMEVGSDLGVRLPPLRLAGEGGLVHGLVFHQRSSHDHDDRWREVEISLGASHDALDVVDVVEIGAVNGEQFFPLKTPREARYVGLRPLSVWGDPEDRRRSHGTGLLRVLAEPGGELGQRRHDLLERDLGGHMVYHRRGTHRLTLFHGMLGNVHEGSIQNMIGSGMRLQGQNVEMVFAFLLQRAARIGGLQWQDDPDWHGIPVERVQVYSATESPVGPWEHQATWNLERDATGMARLALPDMPRARYLRLSVEEPEAEEDQRNPSWRFPRSMAALEADTLGSGRSVLGHWGLDHSRGPLEAEREPSLRVGEAVEDTDSRTKSPLVLQDRMTGRVQEPGDSRHYRVTLDEGDNTLGFTLEDSQNGRLQAELVDPEGKSVPLQWQDDASGVRRAEALDLLPGEYRLAVVEPPRSVIFMWDGSGSVASYQPVIYQALDRFAEGLRPGREVFNMMPLGGPLLINGWAEHPSQVAQTLAAYDDFFSSSDSERSLEVAARALARREGEKAIFLITDAEQGRHLPVWAAFEDVRPRIFTLEISRSSNQDIIINRWKQNQMLSWANVSNGRYYYTSDRSELIRAFESGMRELRQPTTYVLEVERRYQEPPTPGSLRVLSGDTPVVAAGAVHLIFDASGSMLRRMEGGRRIDVAKQIVGQVLDERVPASVPIAFRAFGHTEPHSCKTELLVAPGADNHGQVRNAIQGIQAVNLARTPLAASLDAVLNDLKDYQGQRRLVVMLTDGEETCEGDLEQSVQRLVETGVDVRLNIVGFHIDEIGLQEEFERFAALGGGAYFDSQDGDGLVQGLAGALTATWRVLDADDLEVGRGRIDDPAIELEVGHYELVVDTSDGELRRDFEIRPGEARTIEPGDTP